MGELEPITLVAEPVRMGTWLPTSMEAVWLFSTISLGADTTRMLVRFSSAFKAAVTDLAA